MKKKGTGDIDFDRDYEAIRQVPPLPEDQEDSGRNRKAADAKERIGSITAGEGRLPEAADRRRGNGKRPGAQRKSGVPEPGMEAGAQGRAGSLETGLGSGTQRNSGVREPGMEVGAQGRAGSLETGLGSGTQRNSGVREPGMEAGARERAGGPETRMRAGAQRRAGAREAGIGAGARGRGKSQETDMGAEVRRRDGHSAEGWNRRSETSDGAGDRYFRQKPGRKEHRSQAGADVSGRAGTPPGFQNPGNSFGRRGIRGLALLFVLVLGVGAGLGGGYYLWGWERPYMVDLKAVEMPEWVTQDFLRKNIFSRPVVTRQRVDNIVIHYTANPGKSAQHNRDFFDNQADQDPEQKGQSTSSHFIVGLEGEIIQCIPVWEVAYTNAPRNFDTVTIEVCHPDDSGKFNDATYESVVNLTAWLCKELELSAEDVIRHYDISEKSCPKYFVDHEDAWKQFLKDVGEVRQERS